MPDELKQATPENPSELEQLINEAESAVKIPVTDHLKPCTHVNAQHNSRSDNMIRKCATCLWDYCVLCASHLDPQYCHLCLAEPDVRFEQKPLVDEDGVTHE